MLDINLFRNDLAAVAAALATARRRARHGALRGARSASARPSRRARRNCRRGATRCRSRSASPRARARMPRALLAEVAGIGDETKRQEGALEHVQAKLRDFLLDMPNLLHPGVPDRPVVRGERRSAALGHATPVRLRRQGTTPTSVKVSASSISPLPPRCRARDSRSCAAGSRACIARWRSSCSTRRRASTAIPSAIRPTSSTRKRWSARHSCRNSTPTCSR